MDSVADTEGIPIAGDENFDLENSQIEESYVPNQPPDDTEVIIAHGDSSNTSRSASTDRYINEDLVPNIFKKSAIKNDNLKKLVQIEEKKLAILEEKRASRSAAIEKPDEDMQFLKSFFPT
ncbi:unnamed protein product [Acanthoscelides obtectus]|uniref:Uncharacterized protein n=1 Tax=Acanthoscelides obtectus TaxID=200917 RepID=A0A9P0QCW1_ACAOB|nr:unnamed protein product [Acanthoscelides obtectus]CAK1686717.1 hypothetical protein AOBTE_LOCUS36033 [Acanthoscelides obtectus]